MGGLTVPFWCRRSVIARIALVTLGVTFAVGCDGESTTGEGNAKLGRHITRTVESENGSVELRFTVAPGDLPFDEKATVLVEVDADEDLAVTVDDYVDAIRRSEHPFELSAKKVSQRVAVPDADGRRTWRYRYDLSFVLPGEYELPGAEITYVNAPATSPDESGEPDPTADAEPTTLTTEGVTIIAEATEKAAMTPEQLAEIEVLPPVEMAETRSVWAWLAPVLVILAVVLAILLLRRRRKAKPEVIIVIPAHEWADRALARLVAEDLTSRGLIQEFHYRISDILRGYIERRFSVQAREMTTEEFLAEAAKDPRFDTSANDELDRFLHACDLVKYAKHHATAEDGEALLKTTRAYVARTRERLVQIAGEDDSNEGRAA